jgi:hypothetical protein
MKKLPVLLLAIFSFAQCLQSQQPAIEKEEWSDKPVIHAVDPNYQNEPAVIVLDKRKLEFIDDSAGEVREYYTLHKIIRVNNDKGIEYFNKIYLGIGDNTDIVDIRARTILPGGKVIVLDKNNIKDMKDEDGSVYKIFAMEGMVKGSEVEFSYTFQKDATYFGREVIQSKFPVLETDIELIAPSRLVFDIKPYHCSPESKTDSTAGGKTIMRYALHGLEGLEDEKYASYTVNLARLEYKLAYNNATHRGERLFTWNGLAKKIYGNYTYYTESELKKIGSLVKSNGWEKLQHEPDQIMAVENYLKKYFSVRENTDNRDAYDIEKILKNRLASTVGIVRIYSGIFKTLGINYEFVLTADRDNTIIDREFENWNNGDYPLIYFPKENKFLCPTRIDFRYPWIYPSWGACNGLFCKSTSIGDFTTAIAEIRPIPLEDYQESYNNIESKIKLNAAQDSLRFDMKQIFGGYSAAYYREAFNFSTEEQKQSIIKQMVKSSIGSESILSSQTENAAFENENTFKPFILHAVVNSGDLLERAGNKILLKIGMAIGPQVEMYQEKARHFPIAMEYPHFEERTIEFTVPDGYTIKNPEALKIEQVYKENGEQTMGFVSDYKLTGNKLLVHIMEDYRKTVYPVSQYNDFVKIINASSDFNKIVLVLEKKANG